jgi:tRNA-dihydrouridine synthase A
VPPLDCGRVYRLKARRPPLPVAINGGISTIEDARMHLAHVDGVMLGRAAYQNPEILLCVDPCLFGEEPPVANALEALEAFEPYVATRLAEGVRLSQMTRHILGLFAGRPGARAYRRHLATEAGKPGAGLATLRDAVARVSRSSGLEAAA